MDILSAPPNSKYSNHYVSLMKGLIQMCRVFTHLPCAYKTHPQTKVQSSLRIWVPFLYQLAETIEIPNPVPHKCGRILQAQLTDEHSDEICKGMVKT